MEENNESKEFWEEKRRETGKEIIIKSFARFIGETGKGASGLSGLLFATDERVYLKILKNHQCLIYSPRKTRKNMRNLR